MLHFYVLTVLSEWEMSYNRTPGGIGVLNIFPLMVGLNGSSGLVPPYYKIICLD